MLLTAGERISMALLCMALAELGVPARSFTGSQAGIITDTTHTKARILEVRGDRLRESLADGIVPVVAGFQGVSSTARRHNARTRWLGHDGRGNRSRHGRRSL